MRIIFIIKKQKLLRGIFYVLGLLTLALGIILNTKSGLGVSPIISVSYSISTILNVNFGNMTFVLYTVFVIIEILIHMALKNKQKKELFVALLKDFLQLPLSLVFTRFMNLFSTWIPAPSHGIVSQLLVLFAGIICTGIGAAISLDMRIIPNPGDGIVQAIADCIHKPVGFTKNCFDLLNICISISVGLIFAHKLIGIGVGTVLSVIGVGRVIALFNHLFMKKMTKAAGRQEAIIMKLAIRKMCEDDLKKLNALLSDADVMQYLEAPYSMSQTEGFLHSAGLSDSPLIYAVEENGTFIGYVIYHEYYDENNIIDNGMEIGWVLFKEYWGRGYASELTDMLIELAEHDKRNLVIECVPAQEATRHIAFKNNFQYAGNYDGLDVFIRKYIASTL